LLTEESKIEVGITCSDRKGSCLFMSSFFGDSSLLNEGKNIKSKQKLTLPDIFTSMQKKSLAIALTVKFQNHFSISVLLKPA
jgi:hypothetical protein